MMTLTRKNRTEFVLRDRRGVELETIHAVTEIDSMSYVAHRYAGPCELDTREFDLQLCVEAAGIALVA